MRALDVRGFLIAAVAICYWQGPAHLTQEAPPPQGDPTDSLGYFYTHPERNYSKNPENELLPSHVTVITSDESDPYVPLHNDSTHFYFEKHPKSFYVRFREGAVCKQLNYAGKVVWKLGDEGVYQNPKEIFFQRAEMLITVNFPAAYLVYEHASGSWRLKKSTAMTNVMSNELTIVTADDVSGANAAENDESKYRVHKYDYMVQYEFVPGSVCTEFRLKGAVVWRYDEKQRSMGTPSSIYFHTDLGTLFVDFRDCSQIYRCNALGCKLMATRELNGLSESKVGIFTLDPSGSHVLENDPSLVKRKPLGYAYLYTFAEGARCTDLKYEGKCLWNLGYKSGKEYPSAIFVSFHLKMIVLRFSKFSLVFLHSGKWSYVGKSEVDPHSDSDLTLVTTGPDSKPAENDESKYDVIRYPYSYASLYNLRSNSRCTEVRFRNKKVWAHEPKKLGRNYPTMVYLNHDLKMIIVAGTRFFYVYIHVGKWREAFSSRDSNILEESGESEGTIARFIEDTASSESSSSSDEGDFRLSLPSASSSTSDSDVLSSFVNQRFALDSSSDSSDEEYDPLEERRRMFRMRREYVNSRNARYGYHHNPEADLDKGPQSDPESIRRRQLNQPTEYVLDKKKEKEKEKEPAKSKPVALIVSLVIVGLLVAGGVAGGVFYLVRRKRRMSILSTTGVDMV